MLHIVTEDKGAGKDLWKAAKEYVEGCGCECRIWASESGIGGVNSILSKMFIKECECKKGDFVFLAVDCVGDANVSLAYTVRRTLETVKKLGEAAGVEVVLPNFYCVEELMLSFKKIFELIGVKSNYDSAVEFLHRKLYSFDGYSADDLAGLCEDGVIWKNRERGVLFTKEKILYNILSRYTAEAKGRMVSVRKGLLGRCWFESCDSVIRSGRVFKGSCTGCLWEHQSNDKFRLFDHNSLLSRGDTWSLTDLALYAQNF